MSTSRSLAIADLETQIQQAQVIAQVPEPPTMILGGTGTGTGERTTSQYPTVREGTQSFEPPTQIINPYTNPQQPHIVPGQAGPPPPPPNAAKQAQQRQQQQQQQQRTNVRQALQGVQTGTQIAAQNLKQQGTALNRFLAAIPTPGDIWTPFFILLILFLIIIPVKGHSRLYWLWLVIVGHAHIGTPFTTQGDTYAGLTANLPSGGNGSVTLTGSLPDYTLTGSTSNYYPSSTQTPTLGNATLPNGDQVIYGQYSGGTTNYMSSINSGEY